MSGVFISYRREDASGHAFRLADRLRARFGEDKVFIDADIQPGTDFVATIRSRIENSNAVLVFIGPRWASAVNEKGRRRLDESDDYVRLEIDLALQARKQIFPILIEGAAMPASGELPEEISRLSTIHALRLDHHGFVRQVEELTGLLQNIVSPVPPPSPVAAPKARRILTAAVIAVVLVASVVGWMWSRSRREPLGEPMAPTGEAIKADAPVTNPNVATLDELRAEMARLGLKEHVIEGEAGRLSLLPGVLEPVIHPPNATLLSKKPLGLAPGQSLELRFKAKVHGVGLFYKQSLNPGTFTFYENSAEVPKVFVGTGYMPATAFLGYRSDKPLYRATLQPQPSGFLYIVRLHLFSDGGVPSL